MAFHFATFRTRALTALVFVAVMLTGLFWNFWSFLTLFLVIHFGCWYEFIKLMNRIHGKKMLPYCLLGLLYISLPCLLMIDMYGARELNCFGTTFIAGKNLLPLAIFASIWINDTMAYLVGSFIGRTPLSKISPKKTVEGTVGGMILCVVTVGALAHFTQGGEKAVTITAMCIAAICAVFGTLGDLLESKIKRMADVKDSGSFMPGHGGFLDRFDSMLVATPGVWLFIELCC